MAPEPAEAWAHTDPWSVGTLSSLSHHVFAFFQVGLFNLKDVLTVEPGGEFIALLPHAKEVRGWGG